MQSFQTREEQKESKEKEEDEGEEGPQIFTCTFHNCNQLFTSNEFVVLFSKAEEKDKDQFQKILESLMKTHLFCKTCCSKLATILCMNVKIVVEQ